MGAVRLPPQPWRSVAIIVAVVILGVLLGLLLIYFFCCVPRLWDI